MGATSISADVFVGDGEMAELCRAFDWSGTSLGPPSDWSHSLRTTVGTLLCCRNPMFLFWGPDLIQFYNDAYRPSLGNAGRHPAALGARAKEFWTDIWDTIGPQIDGVMSHGKSVWFEDQYLPIERNGRLEDVWWTYSYSPVRDDNGSIGGTLVVCLETTSRVLGDRQLEKAFADAERANRAKSDFLAVMSHELRTPLNAIDGYAELLELGVRGPITEEQRQDIGRIRKSQRHLLGLINGVLNYARIEAGAVQFNLERLQVAELLAMCEALTAPQMRTKGLTFTVIECGPATTVRADVEKVQQILINLLTNAMKFTDRGGSVRLWCDDTDDSVAISVEDTGTGIPDTQLERVFAPFVQVDGRLTRTQEGVGLGLSISRDLARGMGGEITVRSELGIGSTFTLTLPRG